MKSTSMRLEAATMLREARERIETVGWAKGTERTADGRVCLHRALSDVNGKRHGVDVAQEARRIVHNLIGTTSIPSYNDASETTQDDVITVLHAAEQVAKDLAAT